MANPEFIKTFTAEAAIPANTLVKFGATGGSVVAASAATDGIIGITLLGAAAAGDRVDVTLAGIEEVKLGGTVARGVFVTSDASGYAVAASVAGSGVAGYAMASGVIGDIVGVFIAPSKF